MASTSAEDLFSRVVAALSASGVPYMLTGSFASSFHGAPRTTHDIDIVIAPVLGTLNVLIKQFPEDSYYISREAALQAYGDEGMFNVVDFSSGWKVDFIIRKSRAFSLEEFERRQPVELLGTPLFIASAEDTVISKLEWAKLGGSDRQLRDVSGIISTQGERLDTSYIQRWVGRLSLDQQWERAKSDAV